MSEIRSNQAVDFAPTVFRRGLDVVDIATGALPLLIWAAVGLVGFYALTIVYGAISGYALPSAVIFSAVPLGGAIERGEKYLPRLLLIIAITGALLDWARAAGCELPRLVRNEGVAARLFLRWGILILCLTWLLALSASGWSGSIAFTGSEQYPSLAGLFPYSDAAGHYISPMEQVLTGHWSYFTSRRPIAAGMRELLEAASGFSYVWTLVLQTLLVAAALFAAMRSLIIWRGIWAGFAFCAFGYLITRPFIANMLAEPMGLALGLFSIMFLIDAIRLHNARSAFLGLIVLTFAETIRMGSLFTVPALVLWIAIAFGENLRTRARLFATGCGAVLSVLLVQSLCTYLYGNPTTTTGDNFAFTLCGLAKGGDWTTCPKVFAQEMSRLTTERDQAAFLYAQAIQTILHHPGGLVFGIIRNVRSFVTDTPSFMIRGYGGPIEAIPGYGLLLLVPGLIFTLSRKQARGELLFWFLMLASMAASAAIILQDDGWRAMSVTWPLVALLLSLGCTSPTTAGLEREFKPLMTIRVGSVLILSFVVAMVAAPVTARLWLARDAQSLSKLAASTSDQGATLVGRTLTGFLVLPDGVALPKQTPAIHSSTFVDLIRNVGMETAYGPFLDIAIKKIPFAFVTAVRANRPENQSQQVYLAPADILTRGPAMAWRVTYGHSLQNNTLIHDVEQAQPAR